MGSLSTSTRREHPTLTSFKPHKNVRRTTTPNERGRLEGCWDWGDLDYPESHCWSCYAVLVAVCDRCCHEACVGGKTNYDGSICTTKGTVYYGRSRIAYWSIASQRDNDRLNDIGRARHLYNMENEIPLDSVPIHLVVKLRYKGLRSMIGHWSFHSYLRTRLLFSRASSPGILSSWTHLPSQFSRNSSIWCILAMSTPTATLSAVISKILRFSTQWSGFHYM